MLPPQVVCVELSPRRWHTHPILGHPLAPSPEVPTPASFSVVQGDQLSELSCSSSRLASADQPKFKAQKATLTTTALGQSHGERAVAYYIDRAFTFLKD